MRESNNEGVWPSGLRQKASNLPTGGSNPSTPVMTQPDEVKDQQGKWIKREVMVEEMVEDEGEEAEVVEDVIDNMIENGPIRSKMIGDVNYIQLESKATALKYYMKYKAESKINSTKNRITDIVGE